MERYQFQGRVLPMGKRLSMAQPLETTLTYLNKKPIRLRVAIQESGVTVDCESAAPMTADSFSDAYFGALNLVHNIVDLACFHHGWGLTVVFESWTDPLGETKLIAPGEPTVAGISTSFDTETKLEAPLALLLAEPPVWEALHDLTQSLVRRENTVINCARAIDGVKHLLSPNSPGDKAAWATLRDALNVDEPYVKLITDAARGPRHGNRGVISAPLQTQVMERSWNVMNRYLEFRLRNSGPLRAPDFAQLTG